VILDGKCGQSIKHVPIFVNHDTFALPQTIMSHQPGRLTACAESYASLSAQYPVLLSIYKPIPERVDISSISPTSIDATPFIGYTSMANLAWAFVCFFKTPKRTIRKTLFFNVCNNSKGPGTSVGIATDYGLDDPGSNPL